MTERLAYLVIEKSRPRTGGPDVETVVRGYGDKAAAETVALRHRLQMRAAGLRVFSDYPDPFAWDADCLVRPIVIIEGADVETAVERLTCNECGRDSAVTSCTPSRDGLICPNCAHAGAMMSLRP